MKNDDGVITYDENGRKIYRGVFTMDPKILGKYPRPKTPRVNHQYDFRGKSNILPIQQNYYQSRNILNLFLETSNTMS